MVTWVQPRGRTFFFPVLYCSVPTIPTFRGQNNNNICFAQESTVCRSLAGIAYLCSSWHPRGVAGRLRVGIIGKLAHSSADG